MANWLRKLFHFNDTTHNHENRLGHRSDSHAPTIDVDTAFRRWIMGSSTNTQSLLPLVEQKIIFTLDRANEHSLSSTHLVPRMPDVLPELLSALHNKNITHSLVARHIGRDPSLIAEVIHEANSVYYSPTDKVATLDKALLILGNIGLRMVIAKASMRPIINLQSCKISSQAAPRLWSQSEKCAMAACQVSAEYQANPFEAFLCGLIKNLGMTVAFRVVELVYKDSALPQNDALQKSIEIYGLKFSEWIAKMWKLPEPIIDALYDLRNTDHTYEAISPFEVFSPLGKALYVGDRISKIALLASAQLRGDEARLVTTLSPKALQCYQNMRNACIAEQDAVTR